MDTSKIIHVHVTGRGYAITDPIIKEDYGLYLLIEGLELPEAYEVDFSNSEHNGTSVTMIGDANGVLIPSQFISSGRDIFAFLYHVGEDYGRTVYKFRIPNKLRPDRTDEQPTPEEQSVIDQAISALNEAVAQTAQDVISADQSAQSAADSAESAAASADLSGLSARSAGEYASQASASAQQASASATSASASATSANTAAESAYADAERAEQAAAISGYMWFYIEDGKLYMDRTANTHVNFYMLDGKLYVEEVS